LVLCFASDLPAAAALLAVGAPLARDARLAGPGGTRRICAGTGRKSRQEGLRPCHLPR